MSHASGAGGFDPRTSRVLVVTLHSGEQEFAAGKDAVARQSVSNVEQVVISGLPNRAAHRALFQTIADNASEYDLFVKLDADMVLRGDDSLERLLQHFRDPRLDHLLAPVFDVPSQSNIYGIHLYRTGVKWQGAHDALFPDPNPTIEGDRLILDVDADAEVLHMPDPSLEQAFIFGFHRATKIAQRDRWIKNHENAEFQIALLSRIAAAAHQRDDLGRRMMLSGAEAMLKGRLHRLDSKNDAAFARATADALRSLEQGKEGDPTARWLANSAVLARRRFRYVRLPAFWSQLRRPIHAIYVKSGLRRLRKRRSG